MQVQQGLKMAACEEKIRIGRKHDGGYVLCTKNLRDSTAIISFGINDDWSFEQDAKMYNTKIEIDCYDFSISMKYFFEKYIWAFLRFCLGKLSINSFLRILVIPFRYMFFFRGKTRHFQERVTDEIRGPGEVDIETIFSRTDARNIIVKVDIEGAEYKIIAKLLQFKERISSLILEFHDTEFLREKFLNSLRQISKEYELIHVHGNNYSPLNKNSNIPEIIEMTFTRIGIHAKPLIHMSCPSKGLDYANNPKVEDLSFTIHSNIMFDN